MTDVSNGNKCVLCSLFAICNIVFLVLCVFLATMAPTAVDEDLLVVTPLPQVKDLINDWDAVPFVEISFKNSCGDGEEEVFTKTWYGTERGCSTDEGLNAAPRDTWKDNGNLLADCTMVERTDPIEQGAVIGGGRLCGTRGGKSFAEVTRVDLETGECPSGT